MAAELEHVKQQLQVISDLKELSYLSSTLDQDIRRKDKIKEWAGDDSLTKNLEKSIIERQATIKQLQERLKDFDPDIVNQKETLLKRKRELEEQEKKQDLQATIKEVMYGKDDYVKRLEQRIAELEAENARLSVQN